MKKSILLLIAALIVSQASLVKAEEDFLLPLSIGVYGNANINMHSPNFTIDTSALREFSFKNNLTDINTSFGIIGNFPINETFVISGRFGYNGLGTELKSVDTTMDASLHYLEVSPILQLHNLLPLKRLYFLAGLELDFLLSGKYSVTNPRGTQIAERDIEDPNIRIAGAIGAGYIIELAKNIFLTPEVSFRIPFTKVSKNISFETWDVPQLRAGISLTFGFGSDETEEIESKIPSDIDVGFKEVRYYDNLGNKYPLKSVKVEDIQYSELFPLVPYIFCDANSVTASENNQELYAQGRAGEFTIQNLEPDAMRINTHTLDIIGTRMNQIQDAELTIIGTNDGKEEKSNKSLSMKRAEYAKSYLIENYGINNERINVRSSALPSKPSSSNVADGVEENRRIEFTSTNPALFEPIIIKSENQRLAEPNMIEFVPYAVSKDSITNWELDITQAGKNLRTYSGYGEPPSLSWVIYPNELTNRQIPVDYNFQAKNNSGKSKVATGTIPVDYYSTVRKKEEELPDRTINKYSLILFDFDKADISAGDMKIIEKEIIPAIKYNSTIKIYGYTDRIGEEKYNQELALRRANAVKNVLVEKANSNKIEVFGVGEGEFIFNNDSPIGRHLSRTVQVFVVTPK